MLQFSFVDRTATDVQNRKKEKITLEAIHVSNKGFLLEILQECQGTSKWLKCHFTICSPCIQALFQVHAVHATCN